MLHQKRLNQWQLIDQLTATGYFFKYAFLSTLHQDNNIMMLAKKNTEFCHSQIILPYRAGHIIFAKTDNQQPWPAEIIQYYKKSNVYKVRFFQVCATAIVSHQNIELFNDQTCKKYESLCSMTMEYQRALGGAKSQFQWQSNRVGYLQQVDQSSRLKSCRKTKKRLKTIRPKKSSKYLDGYLQIEGLVKKYRNYLSQDQIEKLTWNLSNRLVKKQSLSYTIYTEQFNKSEKRMRQKLSSQNDYSQQRSFNSEYSCKIKQSEIDWTWMNGFQNTTYVQLESAIGSCRNSFMEVINKLVGRKISCLVQDSFQAVKQTAKRCEIRQQTRKSRPKKSLYETRQELFMKYVKGKEQQITYLSDSDRQTQLVPSDKLQPYFNYRSLQMELKMLENAVEIPQSTNYAIRLGRPLTEEERLMFHYMLDYPFLLNQLENMLPQAIKIKEQTLCRIVQAAIQKLIFAVNGQRFTEHKSYYHLLRNRLISLHIFSRSQIVKLTVHFLSQYDNIKINRNPDLTTLEYIYLKQKVKEWAIMYYDDSINENIEGTMRDKIIQLINWYLKQ